MLRILFNKFATLCDFNFDIRVKKIVMLGVRFSFILTLFATFLMALYISVNHNYILYNLGLSLFKSATTFIVIFFICGIVFNKIIKEKV